MNLNEIENRLLAVLKEAEKLLPQSELQGMVELVQAGEPGIALEDFCDQLYEHDVEVPARILTEIAELGCAMGIRSRDWEMLNLPKLWRLIVADLVRARNTLPLAAASHKAIEKYEDYLGLTLGAVPKFDELELACDQLESYAEDHQVSRDFWLALRDAALKMQLPRANRYARYADETSLGSPIESRFPDSLSNPTLERVHNLAKAGRVIEAIRAYREIAGVGLKEAKDYIDRIEKD
jgi:hypothetical protein